MQRTFRYFVLFLIVACCPSFLPAQDENVESEFRLAQTFEQAGEWERAVALYERVFRAAPGNEVYFEGLQRAYVHTRNFDKAINLVDQRLKTQPVNIGLLASLGGIYCESGSEQKADSVWHRLIAIDPKNVGFYRIVASEMMEHRLFVQATDMYIAARNVTRNENVFADELATLYTFLQEYEAASKEFVRILKISPQQLSFIESRIASFTLRDAGLRAASETVRAEIKREPENVSLRKLSAWLAMEGNDFGAALEEYRIIDRLSNANGAELLDFARRALQEGSHLVASNAFHDVIDLSHISGLVSQARYGFARSMEELSTDAESSFVSVEAPRASSESTAPARVSETEKGLRDVVQLYEAIVRDYPNSDLAAQSYYRIGIIRKDRFFDFNGSLASFTSAKTSARTIELLADASMKVAEVYVLQNNLGSARTEYQGLLRMPIPADQQMAQFRIAELDYFEGKFDSSLSALKPVVSNLSSDLSNDGLLLQYFINENKSATPGALLEFAKADLLMRQLRYSEALARFKEIILNYPTALLVDDATLKVGETQLLLNEINDGIATFQHIVNDMPESILRDRAQMRIAETYQRVLKDKDRAIAAYELVLAKFPNSLYVEQARKRIRQLRGDAS